METTCWWRLARFSLLLLGLSSLVAATQAATYYVAPSGSNSNPGTLAAPFATLQKAHDIANPGDTIYMRGGTYVAAQVDITRNGSSGNYINVFNYSGEVPVLDAVNDSGAGPAVIKVKNASWWHFKGLEIKNGYASGVYLAGPASNNIVEFCNITNKTRVRGSNDDALCLVGSQHVLVEGNWSWENGKKDDLTPSGGNGTGFKLGGGSGSVGLHTIQNSLAWRNRANGFDDNSATLTMNVFNNTSWDNGSSNFSFYTNVAYVLKNNLSFPDAFVFIPATQVVQLANSWNLAAPVVATDFLSLDYSGAAGPRGATGSMPAINFLKLAAGGDPVDKGVNVGLPYNGTAPDLGAYESGAGALPAPTNLHVVSQ